MAAILGVLISSQELKILCSSRTPHVVGDRLTLGICTPSSGPESLDFIVGQWIDVKTWSKNGIVQWLVRKLKNKNKTNRQKQETCDPTL